MGKKLIPVQQDISDQQEQSDEEDSDILQQIEELKRKHVQKVNKDIQKTPSVTTPAPKGKISTLTPVQTQRAPEVHRKKTPEEIRQERIARLTQVRANRQLQTGSQTASQTLKTFPVQSSQSVPPQSVAPVPSTQPKTTPHTRPDNPHRDKWSDQSMILNISVPTLIPDQHVVKKKKYQIRFTYRDAQGKIREATVRFGSTEGKDFTDSQNEHHRKRNETRYASSTCPLDSNYWRYWICNTEPTMILAYCSYIQKHLSGAMH